MKKILSIIYTIPAIFCASCSDLYTQIADNSGQNFSLAITECTTTDARLLDIQDDGAFEQAQWTETGDIFNSVFSDFNRDGNTDILTVKSTGSHSVWFSDGKGNFTSSITFASAGTVNDVCITDLDGNGYPDVYLSCPAGSQNQYYLNSGTGFSGPFATGNSTGNLSVTSADYDNDGDMDIFVGTSAGTNTELWLNKINEGSGFVQQVSWTPDAHNYESRDIASADFDGDGDADMIEVGGSFGPYIRVWINDGSGQFTTGWTDNTVVMNQIITADFDGDGDMDVFTKYNPGSKYLLINNGHGEFSQKTHPITDTVVSAAAGDIDVDGNIDIIISSDTYLTVYRNSGNAEFSSGPAFTSLTNSSISAGAVRAK